MSGEIVASVSVKDSVLPQGNSERGRDRIVPPFSGIKWLINIYNWLGLLPLRYDHEREQVAKCLLAYTRTPLVFLVVYLGANIWGVANYGHSGYFSLIDREGRLSSMGKKTVQKRT